MNRLAAAFYHDPPLWIDRSPVQFDKGSIDFSIFDDEIFRQRLGCEIELRVSREGMFAFGFDRWPRGLYPEEPDGRPGDFELSADVLLRRTLVMNAFLACLYTAVQEIDKFEHDRMVVTPELVISMDGLEAESGMGFGNQRVSHLALSRFESTYRASIPPMMDDRIQMRGRPVSAASVVQAADNLSRLVTEHGEEGMLLADLFLRSSKAYQEHNHSLSLITSWTITEKLLSRQWTGFQQANEKRDGKAFIDGARRKRLGDGRTFTAAVIAETLSLVGDLDLDIYKNLTTVRRARNNWMHNLEAPDAALARSACSVAETMLKQVMGIALSGASGLRIHG